MRGSSLALIPCACCTYETRRRGSHSGQVLNPARSRTANSAYFYFSARLRQGTVAEANASPCCRPAPNSVSRCSGPHSPSPWGPSISREEGVAEHTDRSLARYQLPPQLRRSGQTRSRNSRNLFTVPRRERRVKQPGSSNPRARFFLWWGHAFCQGAFLVVIPEGNLRFYHRSYTLRERPWRNPPPVR